MKLKKYFKSLFTKSPSKETERHHKRKVAIFWHRFLRILTIKLVALLVLALFLTFFGVAFAQAPIHALIDQITKPKPLTQSSKVLPSDVQQEIVDQAKQEIKQEQANALIATNTSNANNSNNALFSNTASSQSQQGDSVIQNVLDSLQIATTSDPSIRAKLKIKGIDRLIAQLQNLLATDRSDVAIDQAVSIIKGIGEQTKQVVTDPQAQTDREILALQIEQYNRFQLILQKLEDQLPINAYLKVEDARQKYLVSGAIASLNAAPNLDAIHNIAIKEVASIVGNNYAELKAIEILTDLQSGLTPPAQKKLAGLQKELALQFEKRMLKLPSEVRTRKLQNFIQLSYGNPLNQAKAFEQMKYFLTDREMILSVDSLKELALQKLENRVFQIKNQPTLNQFLDLSFKSPQDLKILALMKSDVLASGNDQRKKQITDLEAQSLGKVIQVFGQVKNVNAFFGQNTNVPADLLDVSLITQLTDTLNNSPTVSADVKKAITGIKQKTLQQFVANAEAKGFVTSQKLVYNPVSATSDVRILLSSPQSIPLLEELKKELPAAASVIAIAEKAESNIIADHLLTQVNDPVVFEEYKQYIVGNSVVQQTIENNESKNLVTNLDKKEEILQKQVKADDQQLYEKTQQIVQEIFVAGDRANIAATLPSSIQAEITQIKQELPSNSVPKLTTPPDVKLLEVATLPSDVQDALILAAKDQIKEKTQSGETKLDITTEAKDLGVSVPTILPGSLLYPVVEVVRDVALLVKTDPVDRAEELIKQDNEKTLEAAKLVENSQSTTSINFAIKTLDSVKQDFEKLQANVDQVKTASQTEPAKVDNLVNQVIADGVTRETVISSIENKVHGDSYVAVEEIRQEILKDGVNTLLVVTDNNVQKLTDKLENTVSSNTQTPTITVAQDIKAVELLNEIARTQPESEQKILQAGEAVITTTLEKTLLSQPTEQRTQEVSSYVQEATGNPVRQFEALDVLKDDFKNPQTILLAEGLKDKATENLQERISEIPDANSQNTFADQIIGNQPQDLKAITEIASQVAPPQNAGIVDVLPIVQQVDTIKADIVQNIVDTYKDNPTGLAKTDFFTNNPTPDVVDVKVAQDVVTALQSSSDVQPEVVQIAKQEETKIIDTFVANISKPEFQITVSANTQNSAQTTAPQSTTTSSDQPNVSALAAETLNASPDTLTTLIDLKAQASPAEQTKIDAAIKTEITIIKDGLVNQIDTTIAQAAVAQIIDNPVVAKAVEQISGQAVIQAVEQKSQVVQQQATQDQTTLQTTVASVQQEVFSTSVSNPSPIEQTLPQPIQQEIQQIKREVPAAQIPQVNVSTQTSTTVTVQSQPVDTTPVTTTPSQPAAASIPAPQPNQEQAPASNPAPAVPGL